MGVGQVLLLILLFVLILLGIPVRAHFEYKKEKTVLSVRWLFIKADILPEGEKKPAKKSAEKPENKKAKPEKKKDKQDIKRLLPIILDALPKCIKPVRKLLKRTVISNFRLIMVVACGDAHETAVSYGRMNAFVVPAVSVLDRLFTLKVQKADIYPDFVGEEGHTECSADIKITPLAAIAAAVNLGAIALCAFLRAGKNAPVSEERKPQNGK